MAEALGPHTNEKMRELCKKISVAHDLDAEIQEELYSHMEDKLLGYLSGEETLAEEDAFILVREHFGDPSALKGMLQDVHAFEVHVSLARRLAAAIIATAGVNLTYFYLIFAAFYTWPVLHENAGFQTLMVLSAPVSVFFPWLLFWRWQHRLDEGHTPWFLTGRPVYLAGAIALLVMLQGMVGMRGLWTNLEWVEYSGLWRLVLPFMLASPVLQCLVWLWWCDRPPRKVRVVANAAGGWTIWMWSSSSVLILKYMGYSPLQTLAQDLAITFCVMALYAFVSYLLYAIARHAAAGLTLWPEARR